MAEVSAKLSMEDATMSNKIREQFVQDMQVAGLTLQPCLIDKPLEKAYAYDSVFYKPFFFLRRYSGWTGKRTERAWRFHVEFNFTVE